jgi:WD40 repeat protein
MYRYPINERRKTIINLLDHFIINDISKLISYYDYHLEGLAHTIKTIPDDILCADILSDGKIVSGTQDGYIIIWDPISGNRYTSFRGHKYNINCIATLPDKRIISGSDDGTLKIWSKTKSLERPIYNCDITFTEHEQSINQIRCVTSFLVNSSNNSNTSAEYRIISGSKDATLKIWNPFASSSSQLPLQQSHLWGIPNGTMQTGKADIIFCGHFSLVRCVSMLPDGRIVSGSYDHTLKIWDPLTGKCEFTLHGHSAAVLCVATLPDGPSGCCIAAERIVSGSDDRTLKIWNLKTRKCEITLTGHNSFICCVDVLPDGRIISGSYDCTLKIWDHDGKCEMTLNDHSHGISCLKVFPDGRILSGSDDKTFKIWY